MCFDYEHADVFNESFPRARKPHKCDGCGRVIEAGELYWHTRIIGGGFAYSNHVCGGCYADMDAIHDAEIAHGCGENESWIVPEELAEYIRDSDGEFVQATQEAGQELLKRKREGAAIQSG